MRILGVKADDSAVGILGLPAPRGALRVKLGLSAPRGADRDLLNRLWKTTQEGQPPGIKAPKRHYFTGRNTIE